MRTNSCRKKTLVSKTEPKPAPVVRTLPPVDVVVDDEDLSPASERPSKTLVISAADAEALRRIEQLVPQTPVPESRPSMPVRAARATGRGAVVTSAVIGFITLAGALDPDVVRALIRLAHILGEMASALRAGFGGQ